MLQRFGIQPGEHKDFARIGILRDGGDETVLIELWAKLNGFVLFGTGERRSEGHAGFIRCGAGTGKRVCGGT